MPLNLLTGESSSTVKTKGVNLLPDLTEQLNKEDKEFSLIPRTIDTDTILKAGPSEHPISQFTKRVGEFVGLKKSLEERRAEATVIISSAESLAKEKNISFNNALRYERTKREADVAGSIKVFGQVLSKLPSELKISVFKMHQGAEGASVTDIEGIQETIRNAKVDSNKFVEDVWNEYGEKKIFPGIPIKVTDVAQLGQNMGFSLTSMGAGLAVGGPIAFAPFVGSRIVAWGVGTAASGKAAFEMATFEIMQEYLESKNEESIKNTGKGLSKAGEKTLKLEFNDKAREFGLWEAIPEALSNLAFAKLLTAPLTKVVGEKISGRIIARMAGIYGEEFITETITEKGQSAIMQKAGLEPSTGPISWIEAFKRIAPQTFLLSTVLAGTGAIAIKAKEKIMESLKREVKKDNPKYKDLADNVDKLYDKQQKETSTYSEDIEKKELSQEEITKLDKLGKQFYTSDLTESEEVELEKLEDRHEKYGEEKEVKPIEEEITVEAPEKVTKKPITEEKIRESIKDVQIKGRLDKLDSELKTINKEIDSLEKQRKEFIKLNKTVKPIDNKIDDLQKRSDFIHSDIAELLTTEKGKIELEGEKIEVSARTILQQTMKGIRIGKTFTKQQVKTTQENLINAIDKSKLEAKDKAKFIKTIKNIQSLEDLNKINRQTGITVLQEIEQRIERLEQSAEKNRIEKDIKKELKFTKPIKVGQKKIGKFDLTRNRLFEELKSFEKLNQSEAQSKLDTFPEETNDEIDLIKKRMLALKANGKSSSIELFNQVKEDIQRMKALGKEAKDATEFEKLVRRQELVDEALEATSRIKSDKKNISTKIVNVYRRGFSNIYSMLNSMFGKEFAEKYDSEIIESKKNTFVTAKTLEMTEEISTIFGDSNPFLSLQKLSQRDFKITDVEGITTELNKLEIIDIYNSIKNDLGRERFKNSFGESQVESLLGNLTKKDRAFGDYLQETVQSYRSIYNKRNIEITGRDSGFVQNYWPFTSEFQVDVFDDIRIQGETPKALKERAKSSKVIPIPKDAWMKAQKHVVQGEHLDKISRQFETLKRLFNNRKVKHTIIDKFGNNVFSVLQAQIENLSLNAQIKKLDAVSEWFQFAINNWVTAKIALNPSTYIRQLMSAGNYIEQMDPIEWAKGFKKGILNPKKTFDFMWKNAPFLEARFNRGYSEALMEAISGAEGLSVNWSNYTKFLSSLARSGDMTAIIYGGYPLVQSELAKGKSIEEAITTFEKATLKSQQSGLSSSISQFQNSRNPFARLFLAFKNTSNQYFRKRVDNIISYINKDISLEQFIKTEIIYGIIQPIMYASSGFLLKEAFKVLGNIIFDRKPSEDIEEISEKLFLALITQIAVAPVNAIPIIDDLATFAVRKLTGQKVWKVFSTPLFDDLETGIRKLGKKEVNAEDYLTASTSILEPVAALPIKTFMRIFKIIYGDQNSKIPKIGE